MISGACGPILCPGKAGGRIMDREPLLPITVRFKEGAWDVIREIAEESGVSQAEVVRMAVAGNMAKYLGEVRYIDQAQAKEIKALIIELLDVTSAVRTELNRIGVNYNQEVKAANASAKYGGKTGAGAAAFPARELDGLMRMYDQATQRFGEKLYGILM